MHLPQLNVFDPYAHPAGAVRRDKLKSPKFESFAVDSALERREEGAGYAGARREPESPPEEQAAPFEEIFARADGRSPEAALPEDALDAQDLRALLAAADR